MKFPDIFEKARNLESRIRTECVDALRKRFRRPPVEDQVIANFQPVADPCEVPRLNYVIPRLSKGSDYGGVSTGFDIFLNACKALSGWKDIEFRIILTDFDWTTDLSIIRKYVDRSGITENIEVTTIAGLQESVSIRRNDLFLVYNWWTSLNFSKLVKAQAEIFDINERPIIFLIQDYEPFFNQFSSTHMLARDGYNAPARLWGIFNTSNLRDFFTLLGHSVEREFTFEPVINPALRKFLPQVGHSKREKTILVYGRPETERNCFSALVRGLKYWATHYPEFSDWQVLSAGAPHDPVPLGDGRNLQPVGKLSLDDYAQALLKSSVGVSLMASPHPSYPPLEMAHMGMHTVTNTYACKDPAKFHPRIIATPSIGEESLAAAIAEACRASSRPLEEAAPGSFLRMEAYPFMADFLSAVRSELG